MSESEILELRRRHVGSVLSLAYRIPLEIVRGEGAYLFDGRGRRYLDCVNNVCHVGHCHPRVVEAASRQMAELNTNTRYLHDNLVEYARRLSALLPEQLSVCFFVNSGSEANDLALRLARAASGRRGVVVLDGAYHGHLGSLIEISPYKFDGPGGGGRAPHVQVAPTPDPYRGQHRGPGSAEPYAQGVRAALERAAAQGGDAGAFFCESMLGCAGQIVPPKGYLRAAFEHARAAGALCVADEVQVGFGRVGDALWAFDLQGAVPDVVTLGKPIGNGHPLAAVVTTSKVASAFDDGMEYFNTFGGNPVSCAVGLAVLDVIEDEGLVENARIVGAHLLERLQDLGRRFPLIGDVRGAGLFLGIELVRDRATLEPAAREAADVCEAMKERGVLLSTDGPLHNVLKIKPPIVFSRDDADLLADELGEVLAAG